MAAITPDAARPERTFGIRLLGLHHRRFFFIDRSINNGDTWDSGIRGIRFVAWEPRAPDASAHSVAVTFQTAVGPVPWRIQFFCSTSNRMGIVHVWSSG